MAEFPDDDELLRRATEILRIRIYEHEIFHLLSDEMEKAHPEWFDADSGAILRENIGAYVDEVSLRLDGMRKVIRGLGLGGAEQLFDDLKKRRQE